ncbi:MAG: anti-sigma factor family protein [Archangium sp.]
MNCRELETQLTPYLDGELIAEARVAVENHLAGCNDCRAHVQVEQHNLSAIRDAVKRAAPHASDELKSRLFANIRQDDAHRRNVRVGRFMAVAAGVTVAVVVSHQAWRGHQRRLYEQDAALRHARQLPLEIEQSPENIERWFGGKVDYRVTVPRFPNSKAAGARLLQVRDKPAAYIRYEQPRNTGLFVYGDDNDVDVGATPAMGNSHGYNVVSWREGDVVYQLVTDLDEQDLRELVPPTPGAMPAVPTTTLDVRPASLQQ